MPRTLHYLPSFCGRFIVSADAYSKGATIYRPADAAALLQTYRANAWRHAERGEGFNANICLRLGNQLSDALDTAAEWLGGEAQEMGEAA